jgi:cytochrome oxidase Cu insertion factor (SCO1/SenC/PrrC family)
MRMRTIRRFLLGILVGLAALLILTSSAAALEVGQKAPDFTLQMPDGKPITLSDLTAKGTVAMYTFIQAFTGT